MTTYIYSEVGITKSSFMNLWYKADLKKLIKIIYFFFLIKLIKNKKFIL